MSKEAAVIERSDGTVVSVAIDRVQFTDVDLASRSGTLIEEDE